MMRSIQPSNSSLSVYIAVALLFDDFLFPHIADVAFRRPFLHFQHLLYQLAQFDVAVLLLPGERLPCHLRQLLLLALLFLRPRLLAHIDGHPGLLVPSELHQGDVQRAAVPDLQRLHHRHLRVLVLLDGEDGGGLALSSLPRCPLSFRPQFGRHRHRGGYARAVDSRQPVISSISATLSASSLAQRIRSATPSIDD